MFSMAEKEINDDFYNYQKGKLGQISDPSWGPSESVSALSLIFFSSVSSHRGPAYMFQGEIPSESISWLNPPQKASAIWTHSSNEHALLTQPRNGFYIHSG